MLQLRTFIRLGGENCLPPLDLKCEIIVLSIHSIRYIVHLSKTLDLKYESIVLSVLWNMLILWNVASIYYPCSLMWKIMKNFNLWKISKYAFWFVHSIYQEYTFLFKIALFSIIRMCLIDIYSSFYFFQMNKKEFKNNTFYIFNVF